MAAKKSTKQPSSKQPAPQHQQPAPQQQATSTAAPAASMKKPPVKIVEKPALLTEKDLKGKRVTLTAQAVSSLGVMHYPLAVIYPDVEGWPIHRVLTHIRMQVATIE